MTLRLKMPFAFQQALRRGQRDSSRTRPRVYMYLPMCLGKDKREADTGGIGSSHPFPGFTKHSGLVLNCCDPGAISLCSLGMLSFLKLSDCTSSGRVPWDSRALYTKNFSHLASFSQASWFRVGIQQIQQEHIHHAKFSTSSPTLLIPNAMGFESLGTHHNKSYTHIPAPCASNSPQPLFSES